MGIYNICYACDNGYIEPLLVSIASVLNNANRDEKFLFHILDGGLSDINKAYIESLTENVNYIPVNDEDFSCCPLLKDSNEQFKAYHVTIPTYYRFKLPELLYETDKILYLDCDVIVRGSLKELYETNLENKAAALVTDADSKEQAERLSLKEYYNAGIMLINLDYWRKNDISAKLFKFAVDFKDIILWQDQDIINCVLNNSIEKLSNNWNYQYFAYENPNLEELTNSTILHLCGRFKPFVIPFEHPVYDCYYHYLSLTPMKNKILEYKLKGKGKFLENNIGGKITKMLLYATDKNLQMLYKIFDDLYAYVTRTKKTIDAETDVKIHKVYEAIDNLKDSM